MLLRLHSLSEQTPKGATVTGFVELTRENDLPIPPKVSTYLVGGFSRKNTVAVLAYASRDAIKGTGVADNQSLEKLFKEKIIGGKKRTFYSFATTLIVNYN